MLALVLLVLWLSGVAAVITMRVILKKQPSYKIMKGKFRKRDVYIIYKKRAGITYIPEDWFYTKEVAEKAVKILEQAKTK